MKENNDNNIYLFLFQLLSPFPSGSSHIFSLNLQNFQGILGKPLGNTSFFPIKIWLFSFYFIYIKLLECYYFFPPYL